LMALYEGKEMIKQQITASIEKDLKVEKFPYSLIESALRRLKEKRVVESVHGKGGDLYFLAEDQKTKFRLMEKQFLQTITSVKKNLIDKVKNFFGAPLGLGVETLVFKNFTTFLGQVLARFGAECCATIIGAHGKTISFALTDVIEILDDILLTERDERLRNAQKEAFVEYLSNPDENLSDYLYSLAQTYFMIQILHIDPDCQAYTKESLQRKKVYLDTNVIMHSIVGVDKRNKAADIALKLTKQLGIEIRFSKRTKEEFMTLVENSKRIFGKYPEVPYDRFKRMYNHIEDGFLKDYLQKRKENPNLTYDRYADRLEEIEAVLKNRYSVTFDSKMYDEIFQNPDLPELKQIVIEEGIPFGLFKTDHVAEHDAFHILLIQELRKHEKEDILGPNYWFLTHDRSLFYVEKKYGKCRVPSSIFLDTWVELISPLLAPEQTKDARDAYTNLFASRLPLLTKTIKEEDFLALQGKWMDDEDLEPEDIVRIIGNRYVKDCLERVREEQRVVNREEFEKAIQPIIKEIKSSKKKIESLRQTTAELQKKSTNLEQKVEEYEKMIAKYQNVIEKIGYFVGATSFLLLWYFLYNFVLLPTIEPWLALMGAMIISIIFGYLAGFRGYKWLVDRILKYALKR